MSMQKGQDFWQPLLVKILKKKEQGSLSRKKASKKLLRKASKILGLPADNAELIKSANEFFVQARKTGHLLINDSTVFLPQDSQPPRQTSKTVPEERTEEHLTTNRGGAAGPSSSTPPAQPTQKAAKHKHADAADSKPGIKANGQLIAAAAETPSRKKKQQKKVHADAAGSGQPEAQIGVPITAKEAHASQPTDAAHLQVPANGQLTAALTEAPVRKRKKRKKTHADAAGSGQPEAQTSAPVTAKEAHARQPTYAANLQVPGVKEDDQLTAAATEAPSSRKKKPKKAPADAADSRQPEAQINAPVTAKEALASEPPNAAHLHMPAKQKFADAEQGAEKKKKKKKRKNVEAAAVEPAQPKSEEAATVTAAPTAKRRKRVEEPPVEQVAPPVEDTETAEPAEPAAADTTAKKRKTRARNQAAPEQATQAAPKESAEKQQATAADEGRVKKEKLPDVLETLGAAEAALSWRQDMKRKDVKHGRFSLSEKETIKQAVKEYAQSNDLSETDLEWLYSTNDSSKEHKQKTRGAWKTIAQSLPHRTMKAVYCCGTRMLHEGNFKGKWTAEEEDKLKELYAAKGGRWLEIGNSLGRLPEAVRDKYKSFKLGEAKKGGKWTPEEDGKLAKLVQEYLDNRPSAADAPVDGRVVLDDLPWDAISRRHGSRDQDQCRRKWFQQLSPSMVARGDWGAGDDRRMLKALFRSGAVNEWDVDWSALVPGRHAGLTKRRWRLMLKCVPDGADRDFADCIDFLVEAYTPDLKQRKPGAAAADASAAASSAPAEAA